MSDKAIGIVLIIILIGIICVGLWLIVSGIASILESTNSFISSTTNDLKFIHDPTERGLMWVAIAIVINSIIKTIFNK